MKKYDYLVVGAGLFGATFARAAADAGRRSLVIDRRDLVGGNCADRGEGNTRVHQHGPHIFHTNSDQIWAWANRFDEILPYRHKVIARHGDKVYSLPLTLATFHALWGCSTASEAAEELARRRVPIDRPGNLEEQALALVGEEVYHLLMRDYSRKQWGRDPRVLPASLASRLPIRLSWDDRYYHHGHEGLPRHGYTPWVAAMLEDPRIHLRLGADLDPLRWRTVADRLVCSGSLDELFRYRYGQLDYRGLVFRTSFVSQDTQGVAQVNYTDERVRETRSVDYGYLSTLGPERASKGPRPIVWETPCEWSQGRERYYPLFDSDNRTRHRRYLDLAGPDMIVGGRLGSYRYMDMDQTIASALAAARREGLSGPQTQSNISASSGPRVLMSDASGIPRSIA